MMGATDAENCGLDVKITWGLFRLDGFGRPGGFFNLGDRLVPDCVGGAHLPPQDMPKEEGTLAQRFRQDI